jgi:hypothetical protein
MAHPDYDAQISYPEPELMTALRDEYAQDGTLDMLADTAAEYGHEMFDEPTGPEHSWIAFAIETYQADPNHLNTVFDTFIENGVPFNEEYYDANGRNELSLIADHFGYGGIVKALAGGIDVASAAETDNDGKSARSYVEDAAGPKGLQLIDAYEANQRHHDRASWVGAAFGAAGGIVAAIITRQPEAAVIVGMAGAGLAKIGGNSIADDVLANTLQEIGRAGNPALQAA